MGPLLTHLTRPGVPSLMPKAQPLQWAINSSEAKLLKVLATIEMLNSWRSKSPELSRINPEPPSKRITELTPLEKLTSANWGLPRVRWESCSLADPARSTQSVTVRPSTSVVIPESAASQSSRLLVCGRTDEAGMAKWTCELVAIMLPTKS